MNSNITKEEIEALKAGDHQIFEKIFLSYFKNVKVFVQSLIKSEHEAEEITQELFSKLWINRESIDTGKNFHSFIFISAKNAALNFLKWRDIRDSFYNDQMLGEEETNSVENDYYAKEAALLIELVVSKMPEQRQKVYTLSRNGGVSNEEIAKMLNITKKTVENHLNLALKEVKKIFRSAKMLLF